MKSSSSPAPGVNALVLSLLALGLASTGCNGGGGGRRSTSTTAAVTSQTGAGTTPTTSGTTVTPPPTATVGAAVSATLALNHFAAIRETNSLSDLQIPASPALAGKAFLVEDKGYVRVLDLAGAKPILDRAIQLNPAGPLAAGGAMGALAISDDRTALAVASGKSSEAVYIFDPLTAKGPADVTQVDLTALSVTFTTAQKNSKGVAVASPMLLSYTASALVSKGKLFVASSNLDPNFDLNPGTVVAFDYNPTTRALSGGALMVTTCFNPTRLTAWKSGGQEALLCVSAGVAGAGPSCVDVIDPVRAVIVASIPLGNTNASGAVAITADGKRGFVASQGASEVYELDLTNLGALLNATTPTSEPARFVGTIQVPGTTGLNFVSGVALSSSGSYLYAINFNASSLSTVDIQAGPGKSQVVGTVTGFARSADPTKFQGNTGLIAVRPGTPGTAFTGPSVLVGTISLAPADRTVGATVTAAIDGVRFDRN